MWPFYAIDQTCVDCHNSIQGLSGAEQWQMGDLMGAQVVEKNIGPQLSQSKRESGMISALVFFAVIAVSYCFIFIFRQMSLTKKLKILASTDAMTGCINQREMHARINSLENRVSGVILMLDIDKFKQINDTYGHATGDIVIQELAERVQLMLGDEDWVARVGGEEFLVWLPDITQQKALTIAESLRQQTESPPVETDDKSINYTVSIGLYSFKNAPPSCFNTWVAAADKLLYQAKEGGRNRVVS